MTWQELDIEAMTNLYLYGTLNAPSNKVDETLIRESGKTTTIYIDNVSSFMNDGPGRFAVGANSSIVKQFMEGGLFSAPGEYKASAYFSTSQLGIAYQQYLYNDLAGDFTERTYIYNSSSFVINPNVIFVVKADGKREIKNYSILPYDDNFDFESDDGAAKIFNPILNDWVDPSDIGRSVKIKFSEDGKDALRDSNKIYTLSNFIADSAKLGADYVGLPSNFLGAGGVMYLETLGMWSDGTTRFVDSQGRAIIYGTDGNNSLSYEKVQSLNFLSPMYLKTSESDGVVLIGGKGSDALIGTSTADSFLGGTGFDRYIAGDGDTLKDSDGKGLVAFEGIDLTGKKYKNKDTGRYEDDDYIYNGDPKSTKGTLTVTAKNGSKSITIQEWSNKELGIELTDSRDIDVSITKSASAGEGDSGKRRLSFTVTLSRALEDGESLKVSVSSTDEGSYTFKSGEKSHTFTHSWYGDTKDEGAIDHIATLAPTASYSGPYTDVKVKVLNSGTATVYDDDEENRHDPLALDMNMDGFISTTALETSGTYFDITGDGLKERVGWIRGEDALLTYDKNENAQIDGIDEVFGNANESGFEELKRTIDSNHDNKIDRRDELFAQLQVWNDLNQDGAAQSGELQSLSEAGITSIDLNYVSTNIEINGNLLVEASKYTDTTGNKELVADIQLATDVADTKVDINDIPNFTIDPITHLLPQLRGSGLVYDSFIRYNMDPEFKAIANNQIQRKVA